MRTIFRSLLVVLLQTLLLAEAAHAAPGGTPADLSLSDITGASNYFVGQTVFFQITLSDLGPNPSSNVVVNTTLPVGLAFVSAVFSPGESYDETANLWYVTNLPTSSPVTLYLAARVQSVGPWTNTATIISSSTTDPVSSNNTTSATITGIPAPPPANLTIFKSANVTNVFVGGEVDFQIIVTNLGTVDASNILVTETLPSGLSLLSADVFNSASSFDSSSGVWSITNLVAGDSVTLIVSAQVNSPGTLTNTASILLSSPSNTNTANRASATVTGMPVTGSTPEADLAITKTASTSVVQTGDVVSFTLTVTNLGPDDASNVVVQEYMPNAIGTLGATAPGGTTYDVNAQQWLIPFLGNGQSISLVITGQVAESDEGGDTITEYANTATIVASLPYDPDLDNNSATVTLTTPLAETSVALAKTADQSSILIGGTVNFSITITNIGPDAVPQATVEDDMPAGLQVSGWTAPPGTGYDPGTGLWSITNLPSSSSLTLVISAIGTVAGTQINTAEITALDALDTGGLNHQASATVLVTVSQYTINSSAGPGGSVSPVGSFLVNGGDSVTFTATPQTGYQVSTWSLDGVAVQTGGLTYYLPEIQASHSVQVTFTPMSFCSGLQLAVNFVDPANAGTEMMSPDDLAGAVVQPGWVNAIGPSGSVPLTTGATVTWGAPGTASLAPVGLSPDFTMMQGYLSCIGGSSVINVGGINLPSYDVYVYCAGNNLPGETRVGRYTLNGGTSLYAQDVAGLLDFDGSYVQSTSATGGPGAAIGNYVVFHNVTGSSFILTAQGDSTSGTFLDAPVNGLQIVPSSGSTAPSLPVPLRFTSISPTGSNTIHTVLTGTPGTPIEVDVSSNLVNWEQRFFLFNSNGVVDLVDTTPTNQSRYYRATQGGAPGDFGDLDYSGGTGDSNSMGQLSFEGGLGNLQFDWQSLDPVLGAMNSGFTLASNVNFYAGTLTCAPRVTFQGTAGGARFNVTMDLKTGGQAIVDVFQTISNVLQQVRFVLTFNIKLDIDADNNNGLGLPDRNAAERKIKDDAAFPGKVVRVNDTDEDNDGIPGFADFDDAAGKQFAEMVLEIPAPIDLTKAQITFTYNASDPAGVLVGGPPAKRVYFPGAGNLRIWTKDAGVARDKTSAGGTGNYIPTEVKMPVSKLGFTGAVRTNVFYVEGIAPGAKPGDQRIVAAVDALGDGTVVFKDAVRVSVVKVSFSRAPTENAAGNKFGYDEMSPAQNDDQVSVAQNDSTFVNVSIQGLTNAGPLVFISKDTTVSKVTVPAATPAAGFLLQLNGQNTTKGQTRIEAHSGTPTGDLCAVITNDVYRLKTLDGKYYQVYITGKTNTMPPSVPKDQIVTNANNFLKYPVIGVTLEDPIQKAIAFDTNGNGRLDYYNNGPNPELDKLRADLKAAGVGYADMVMLKDSFFDNWYVSTNVPAGATKIKMPGVGGLSKGGKYRIARADDSDAENFTITAIDAATGTITITPALTRAHARTANLATTSTVKDMDDIAGLSSNVAANSPALLIGATAAKTGKLLAHEQMHGQGLSDVDNEANVMHWNTGSKPTIHPFTYNEQIAVITGTTDPKDPIVKENQWAIPAR